METLDRKLLLTLWHFLMAVMVLASITVTPLSAQVGLDVGQKAPDFTATGLDGKTHRLSTVTAASISTVVYFWATWCPGCVGVFPGLETLSRKLKAQGVTLLAVNFKETASTAKMFAEEAGTSFPMLLDTDGKIAAQFLVWPLPAIFVLDANGIVRHKFIGATNTTALETKIIAVTRGD